MSLATHTGMTVEAFHRPSRTGLGREREGIPASTSLTPKMVYQPMLEVMRYLRANGYRTYIVTGGGQDFVRAYAQRVYGIPPEQIIGSALETKYEIQRSTARES